MTSEQKCPLCGEKTEYYARDGTRTCKTNIDCVLYDFPLEGFKIGIAESQIARIKQEAKQEFIDLICPNHGRTSCNDKFRCNVLGCNRCTLMELLEEGYIRDSYTLIINLEKKHGVEGR